MRNVAKAALLGAAALLVAGVAPARAEEDGEKTFKKYCAACHTTEAGKNKIGPSLAGVLGRKAGSIDGFAYSEANKGSGVVWDEAKLDQYLSDPKQFMPGNKMVFPGVKKSDERSAVIAFLKSAK
jgi:cytochrome c